MQTAIQRPWKEQRQTATGETHADLISSRRELPPLKDVAKELGASGGGVRPQGMAIAQVLIPVSIQEIRSVVRLWSCLD